MAYESPITLFMSEVEYKLIEELDATTLKAVQKCFPYVDRDELLKALEYDRGQYEKGYADGHAARDAEIVRCKDCKWFDMTDPCGTLAPNSHRCKRVARLWMEDDAFCAYGERRDDG